MPRDVAIVFTLDRPGAFACFYRVLVWLPRARVAATRRQCEALSMGLPCGLLIPGTAEPARRLVRAGAVFVPADERAAIAAALTAALEYQGDLQHGD